MSKYIPKSRIKPVSSIPFKGRRVNDTEWHTFSSPTFKEQKYVNPLIAEKERVESIPLKELSFRDLYQFPFYGAKYGSRVYDANHNFIFQFQFNNKETKQKILDILNEELSDYTRQNVEDKEGEIYVNGIPFILIRGWGNLTGNGAYNLDGNYAVKIQDTLNEYIIEKLKL